MTYPLYHQEYTAESNPTLSKHDAITRELIKESELNEVLLFALEKKQDYDLVIYTLIGIIVVMAGVIWSLAV